MRLGDFEDFPMDVRACRAETVDNVFERKHDFEAHLWIAVLEHFQQDLNRVLIGTTDKSTEPVVQCADNHHRCSMQKERECEQR